LEGAVLAVAVIAVVGQLSGLAPLPPLPSGTWACTLRGEVAGTLSVEGTRYQFTTSGTEAHGTLAVKRARLGYQSRASLVRVWSGPLKETFGISLGFHNRAAEPETLVFNIGPGEGLQCLKA
jgi:hypothetical protein